MQLSNLKIALERYSSAQAIQLGFAVARQFYWRLFVAHLLAALPVVVGLCLLQWLFALSINVVWLLLVYWWFLPFYERTMLWCLSRLIFAETLHPVDYLDAVNLARQRGFWQAHSLQRLSSSRSFLVAVNLLEQLSGQAAKTRKLHLCRSTNGILLTLGFWGLQWVLGANLLMFGYMLTPEEWWHATQSSSVWSYLLMATVLANLLLTPFYVATGFTLYLSQRINIEGWNIEIQFKLLAERFKKGANHLLSLAGLLLLAGVISSNSTPSYAQPSDIQLSNTQQNDTQLSAPQRYARQPDQQPISAHSADQKLLKSLVAQDKFFPYDVKQQLKYVGPSWQLKPKKLDDSNTLSLAQATLLALLARIVLVLGLIGLVGWLLYRYRVQFSFSRTKDEPTPPELLFGLDVRQSVSAATLLQQAEQAFLAGDFMLCLSLLYRGALIDLIHQQSLKIRESDTEGDCVRLVEQSCCRQTSQFFAHMTRLWQSTVYAHRPVDPNILATVLQEWPVYFLAGAAK